MTLDYAFAGFNNRIDLFDISHILPVKKASLAVYGPVNSMETNSNYLYAAMNNGISIYEIGENTLTFKTMANTGNVTGALKIADGKLYTGDNDGIKVYKFEENGTLTMERAEDTCGSVDAIEVTEGEIALHDWCGFTIYDKSTLAPVSDGDYSSCGNAAIKSSGENMFVRCDSSLRKVVRTIYGGAQYYGISGEESVVSDSYTAGNTTYFISGNYIMMGSIGLSNEKYWCGNNILETGETCDGTEGCAANCGSVANDGWN